MCGAQTRRRLMLSPVGVHRIMDAAIGVAYAHDNVMTTPLPRSISRILSSVQQHKRCYDASAPRSSPAAYARCDRLAYAADNEQPRASTAVCWLVLRMNRDGVG